MNPFILTKSIYKINLIQNQNQNHAWQMLTYSWSLPQSFPMNHHSHRPFFPFIFLDVNNNIRAPDCNTE